MTKIAADRRKVRFHDFEVDLHTRELRKNGVRIRLVGHPFEILALLLEAPGEMVTREQLRERLWPRDTFVDFEHGLNSAVNKLREALADSASQPRYVETVPRRGYRFIAQTETAEAPSAVQPQPATGAEPELDSRLPGRRAAGWALAVGILLVALALASRWVGFLAESFSPKPGAERAMLAVLPFENLTKDPEQDYFGDGLTEQLITELGRLDPRRLGVIARTSAVQYQNAGKGADQIARELGVEYLLEGSVRRDGERVRITAQLIRASDQTHLWAQSYDRELRDILDVQSDVARAVADSIQLALTPEQAVQLASSRVVDPQALESYLRGRYFWHRRGAQDLLRAREYFESAGAADANYASAHVGLADALILLASYGMIPTQEGYATAKSSALRALELDPALAEAHASLGTIAAEHDWNWQEAEQCFRRAIELQPNYATAHQWYAEFLAHMGRFEEAQGEAQLARRLNPLSAAADLVMGKTLYYARRFDEAIQHFTKTLEAFPGYEIAQVYLALAYLHRGNLETAAAILEKTAESAEVPEPTMLLAYVYGRLGRERDARRLLNELHALRKRKNVSPFILIVPYLALGENARALEWMEKAYQERNWQMVFLNVEPLFDPLRGDARFQAYLRKLNFPKK